MKRIIILIAGLGIIGCTHLPKNNKYPECMLPEKVAEISIQDYVTKQKEFKSALNGYNKKVSQFNAVHDRFGEGHEKIVEFIYPNEFKNVKNILGYNSELKDLRGEDAYALVSEVTLNDVRRTLDEQRKLVEEKQINYKKAFKELDKSFKLLERCYREAKEERYKQTILGELRAIKLQLCSENDIERIGILNIKPNAYGLGINVDQYGRPTKYRLSDGKELPRIFYDDVKRDAYGLGVHMDPFGRPVYDSLK
jgi:hypothetical protein